MNVDKPDVFQGGENFRGYVVERLLGKGGIGAIPISSACRIADTTVPRAFNIW